MKQNIKNSFFVDKRALLSTLWIFAMLNYIYADVMSLMDPLTLSNILSGGVGPIQMTPTFLLGAAVLMETAIAMVFLSRFLKRGANRIANVVVAIIHTLSVTLSMLTSPPPLFYIFFAVIEITCTVFIILLACTWKEDRNACNAAYN